MRHPHILKANKNNETVHNAVWFDTETQSEQVDPKTKAHRLWFGWTCYRKRNRHGNWSRPEYFRFTTRREFSDWLCACVRPKTKLYVFVHNTSFDLPVVDLFHELPAHGWKLTRAIIDAPPTVLTYTREKSTIVVIDTLNIWRMSLAELGKMVRMPKLKMPDPCACQARWDAYCRRDVKVIMRACIQWWDFLISNNFGGFSVTAASQAMRTFRHKYMASEIFIDAHAGALKIARESYHGGRTECFFIGEKIGQFVMLDVNAMYPYLGTLQKFPIHLTGFTRYASVADLCKWVDRGCVVARCRIVTDHPVVPLLNGKKLYFPIGRFETVLTTPEIEYIQEHGTIEKVWECAVYDADACFADYMSDLYNHRKECERHGDTTQAGFFKLMANSFLGKWGQKGNVWTNEDTTEDLSASTWVDLDLETGNDDRWRQFGGMIQRLAKEVESVNSHPAIAGHVTAYGRIMLWNLIRRAGVEHCYYCDTDSILLDVEGFDRLIDLISPDEIGKLKVVGAYSQLRIYTLKDYEIDHQWKCKGIRKNAIKLVCGGYQQEKWSSLRGLLRHDSIDTATTSETTKHLKRIYDKGIIQSDGRVMPFELR